MNLTPLLEQLSIAPKQQGLTRLKPNRTQRRIIQEVEQAFDEDRPARIIVLKARQMGVSTVSEALLFSWAVAFPDVNCCVAAHDLESSIALFQMVRLFYDEFPFKKMFPSRFASQNRLTFKSNRSGIYVVTASKKAAGRGRTFHLLHASELAFWKDAEDKWLSFRQSVPDTKGSVILIESTANGLGNLFEQMWGDAVSGNNEFVPLFFPWFEHHEYIPCFGATCEDATCDTCEAWGRGVKPRTSAEHDLVKLGCRPPQLAWRRWAIANRSFGSEELFCQEYPATPEEAFLASGINVFPETALKNCYEPMTGHRVRLILDERQMGRARLELDPQGPLRLFKKPVPGQTYFLGADAAYGHGNDLAAACVINRQTKEQVAVFHAKLNPVAFADELAKLAAWYNYATIAPEVEGSGQALVGRLSATYPHIWTQAYADKVPGHDKSFIQSGWSTTWRRKAWLLSTLANEIELGRITIHDSPTFYELRNYVYMGARGYELWGPGQSAGHDDLVMALAIAVLCEKTEPAVPHPQELEEAMPRGRFGILGGPNTPFVVEDGDSEWR